MSLAYATQRGLTNSAPLRRWSQMRSFGNVPTPPITNPTIGMTAQGSAQTSTAQVKFGTASMLASGTGGNSFLLNSTGDFNFWPSGTGDFTVQWWQYIPSSVTGAYMEFSSNNATGGFSFRLGDSFGAGNFNSIGLFARQQADLDYFNITWTRDTWQFVSITRNAATMYVHVDGTSIAKSGQGSGTADTRNFVATTGTGQFQLGSAGGNGLRNVYVDDFQVFGSTAIYTSSSYTPPTSQAILTTGTTLLLNMNGSNGGTSFPNVTSN
jgi:hypothetical protein